jgi:hypothetical protein
MNFYILKTSAAYRPDHFEDNGIIIRAQNIHDAGLLFNNSKIKPPGKLISIYEADNIILVGEFNGDKWYRINLPDADVVMNKNVYYARAGSISNLIDLLCDNGSLLTFSIKEIISITEVDYIWTQQ